MTKLGVNIDHVATLRQARGESSPDPIEAAKIAQQAGANSIVCHLREDRRHIQDRDVVALRKVVTKPLNLEMSLNPDIIKLALKVKPDYAMFVPERRQEITTEGGLDVHKYFGKLSKAADQLNRKQIVVSVFIDPVQKNIRRAQEAGAKIVELHTGKFANCTTKTSAARELKKLHKAADYAKSLGLIVHAGHGLKYHNADAVARIQAIDELNIGHAIVSEAVFSGLAKAVRKMKRVIRV